MRIRELLNLKNGWLHLRTLDVLLGQTIHLNIVSKMKAFRIHPVLLTAEVCRVPAKGKLFSLNDLSP